MHPIQALRAFFRVLFHGEPQGAAAAAPPPPDSAFKASGEPAIQLLGLFQKEGRLIDFLRENIAGFGDAEVGAAVREIHAGCRRVLDERLTLEPIVDGQEGARVDVPAGFDASAISVSGNVTGDAPYAGTLRHRGWRVTRLDLPTVPAGADTRVAAPAQVEIA